MNFPEARRVAKDINAQIDTSAASLKDAFERVLTNMDDVFTRLVDLSLRAGEKKYVVSDNKISGFPFTAQYNGTVRVVCSYYTQGYVGNGSSCNMTVKKDGGVVARVERTFSKGEGAVSGNLKTSISVVKGEKYTCETSASRNDIGLGTPVVKADIVFANEI